MKEGWFDDPRELAYQRYWDGQKWTEWVVGPPTPNQVDQLNELKNIRWGVAVTGVAVIIGTILPHILHGW